MEPVLEPVVRRMGSAIVIVVSVRSDPVEALEEVRVLCWVSVQLF